MVIAKRSGTRTASEGNSAEGVQRVAAKGVEKPGGRFTREGRDASEL